jgi:hypothetical protein
MSEDKKPKIDLKARLGKKTVSSPSGSGSIPPPAGIPRPVGVGGAAIPAPPFQQAAPRPVVDPSNPFGAMEPAQAPVRAEPAAIKIELSDEVVQAQKSGRSKILALAGITAVVGGIVGFSLGSGSERAKGQESALAGASELSKEVEAANKKIEELADTLKAAREKLAKAQFPEAEVTKLGAINIPFSGANLSGKGIGRFKSDLLQMLIEFASSSTEANDQKETIQNVLSGNKKGVQEFLDGQSKPVVRWSVIVSQSPLGPVASMKPVPSPFLVMSDEKKDGKDYSWPESYDIQADGKKTTVKRYLKGEPFGEELSFIPVDPSTQASVCPADVVVRIRRELTNMEEVLRGNPNPGEEKVGLLETGKKLEEKLKDLTKGKS